MQKFLHFEWWGFFVIFQVMAGAVTGHLFLLITIFKMVSIVLILHCRTGIICFSNQYQIFSRAIIYTRLGNKGKDLTMPMKFTLGMFLCALGFLTAAAAGLWFADAQGLTSPWFIVLVYLFQSLGELLISALGLAMVAALVPQHLMGFILGMWFLTQAAAFLMGGYVATFTAVPENITDPLQTLPVYTSVFSKIGLVTLGVTMVMALLVPWLNRMINTPSSDK